MIDATGEMVELSFVIVNTNNRDQTIRFLKSIYRHLGGISFEVVLVDNNSQDGSADAIEELFPRTRIIRKTERRGWAYNLNTGILRSTGRYIAILNDDMELADNPFVKLIEYLSDNRDVGAVGPRLVLPDGTIQQSYFRSFPGLVHVIMDIFHINNILNRLPSSGTVYTRWGRTDRIPSTGIVDVAHLMGAAMIIPREVLEQVGILDGEYLLSFEDMDLCRRIQESGFRIVHYPEVQIKHYHFQTSKKLKEFTVKAYIEGELRFFGKFYGRLKQLLLYWILASLNSLKKLVLTIMVKVRRVDNDSFKLERTRLSGKVLKNWRRNKKLLKNKMKRM